MKEILPPISFAGNLKQLHHIALNITVSAMCPVLLLFTGKTKRGPECQIKLSHTDGTGPMDGFAVARKIGLMGFAMRTGMGT